MADRLTAAGPLAAAAPCWSTPIARAVSDIAPSQEQRPRRTHSKKCRPHGPDPSRRTGRIPAAAAQRLRLAAEAPRLGRLRHRPNSSPERSGSGGLKPTRTSSPTRSLSALPERPGVTPAPDRRACQCRARPGRWYPVPAHWLGTGPAADGPGTGPTTGLCPGRLGTFRTVPPRRRWTSVTEAPKPTVSSSQLICRRP